MRKLLKALILVISISTVSAIAFSMCSSTMVEGVSSCNEQYPRYTGDPQIDADRAICLWEVRLEYDACLGNLP